MFSLSHNTFVLLLVSIMLVSVMLAGLFEVTSAVVVVCGAILLTFVTWGDIYCNQIVIV